MWIKKTKIIEMQRQIADLKTKVQNQQFVIEKHLSEHQKENAELREIISNFKNEIYNGVQQML